MYIRALRCTLLGLLLTAVPLLYAPTVTYTWTGATTRVLDDGSNANWLGGVAPSNDGTAQLVFGVPANPNAPQAGNVWLSGVANPFSVASITFSGNYPLYSFLSESGHLAIGAGGITVPNTGAGNVIFSSGVGIQLNATQTWTASGNLFVYGAITNPSDGNLTKSGTGFLVLGGNSPGFSGSLTVAQGTLYLASSANPAGTGNLILQSGTTLAPSDNSVSIPNNVTVSNNVTFAKALNLSNLSPNTPDTTIAGSFTAAVASVRLHVLNNVTLRLNGALSGPSGTALTFDSGGTVILAGSTSSTISSLTADTSGVVFAAPGALLVEGSSVQAVNGGYISVAATSGGVPSPGVLLALITNKAAFNGTFGFDTDPTLGASYTYTDPLDFSGFSTTTFKIGSATSAVLSSAAVITPPANVYRFGGGGGLLRVESNLSDNGVTPRTLTVASPAGDELTLWLAGTNSFTGSITIDNSLLRIASPGALSSGGSIIVPSTSRGGYLGFDYDPGTTAGTINLTTLGGRIVPGGGPLVLGFDSASLVAPRTITAPIDLSTLPSNTILGTATNVTLNGPNSASLTPAGSPSAPYRFAAIDHGSLTIATQLTGIRGVEIGIANTGTNFSPGTDKGPNNVTLANASNTYSGGTTIFDGVLHLTTSSTSSAGTILFGPLGTGPVTIASTATNVGLQPDSSGGPPITVTLDNPMTVNANASFGDSNFGNSLVLNGAISGPAHLSLLGKVTLSTANAYMGGTDLSSYANVIVNSNTGLGTGNVSFGYGATVTFTTTTPNIGGLSGGGYGIGGIVLPANATSLAINQTQDGTFTGNISGPSNGTTTATLVKNGSNGLVLTGTDNYSGGTIINGGKLVAGSAGALGTGTVTINGGSLGIANSAVILNSISFGAGGGTLGGNGTIGSNITVGSNIKLAPGNSPGTLTFTGALTWAAGGSYNLEIVSAAGNVPGTSYDTIVIASTGSLTITAPTGGKFNLSLLSLSSPSTAGNLGDFNSNTSYSWQIASSTNAIAGFTPGAFNLDTTGFTNPLSGGVFNLSLGGPGGNTALFLNFTPVPEPSTWALMIVGAGAVLFPALRRRRR